MAKIKTAIEDFRPDPKLIDERGPTPERREKLRPSPINLALEAQKLTKEQALAAEKFYKHWHQSGLVASIPSPDMARVFGGDGFQIMPRTDNQAFHRDRYRKAREVVIQNKGFLSFWALEQVVCMERGFTEVGALFGHKNRTKAAQVSFDMVSPALNLLCREWGIS